MLSNHPLKGAHPKLNHLQHGLEHFREDAKNMFEIFQDEHKMWSEFVTLFGNISRDIYDDSVVKELYKRKDEFDLFLIDGIFNEV